MLITRKISNLLIVIAIMAEAIEVYGANSNGEIHLTSSNGSEEEQMSRLGQRLKELPPGLLGVIFSYIPQEAVTCLLSKYLDDEYDGHTPILKEAAFFVVTRAGRSADFRSKFSVPEYFWVSNPQKYRNFYESESQCCYDLARIIRRFVSILNKECTDEEKISEMSREYSKLLQLNPVNNHISKKRFNKILDVLLELAIWEVFAEIMVSRTFSPMNSVEVNEQIRNDLGPTPRREAKNIVFSEGLDAVGRIFWHYLCRFCNNVDKQFNEMEKQIPISLITRSGRHCAFLVYMLAFRLNFNYDSFVVFCKLFGFSEDQYIDRVPRVQEGIRRIMNEINEDDKNFLIRFELEHLLHILSS